MKTNVDSCSETKAFLLFQGQGCYFICLTVLNNLSEGSDAAGMGKYLAAIFVKIG